jgi:hypothetical protein
MKNVLIALMMVLLVGCATSAPSQGYRPANYAGAPWNISGEKDQVTNAVVIKINNQVVISNTLSLLSSDGEFSGSYEGKPVTASCMTDMNMKTNCFVFINGEKAATLSF